MSFDARALILFWVPVAIAKMVSVTRNPSVDTFRIGTLLRVPMWTLLVITVESDSGCLRHLFAFSVVLDNLPVLLHRDINIAELDLSLGLFLNLGQLFPLN